MINPAKDPADQAGPICLERELTGRSLVESATGRGGAGSGAEIIRLMRFPPAGRAQLRAVQRIEVSLRFMLQNLDQQMRVPVLSAMVGLSESSFFALFKSVTGLTPLDFFIRARMQRAGELLINTTLQIKEVAARLGYDDQFYFSRLFKSVHGVPPREFRARGERMTHPQLLPTPSPAAARRVGTRLVRLQACEPVGSETKGFPKGRRAALASPASVCPISVP